MNAEKGVQQYYGSIKQPSGKKKGIGPKEQVLGTYGLATGWVPIRFKPGSGPEEPNRFEGVYKGCKTLFLSFPSCLSLSTLFLER